MSTSKKRKYQENHCLINHNCVGSFVAHHIRTRKSGGSDDQFNLMPLCVQAHNEIHQIGLISMVEKYPELKEWLDLNGWEFDAYANKFLHN